MSKNSRPRSHIYIAGSLTTLKIRNETDEHQWKIGHAYCLVDRFYTAPDSYHAGAPKNGYWPKCVWHWVDCGSNHEKNLVKHLGEIKNRRLPEGHIGWTETFEIKYKELVDTVNDFLTKEEVSYSITEFSWAKDGQDFINLRDCLLSPKEIDDVEKYRRSMEMIKRLKPSS